MMSMQRHLMVGILLGLLVLVLAIGFGTYQWVRRTLNSQADLALGSKAAGLMALVEPEAFGVEFTFTDDLMPEFGRTQRPEFFQVWNGTHVLRRSASLNTQNLMAMEAVPVSGELLWSGTMPNGTPGRFASITRTIQHDTPPGLRNDPQFHAAAAALGDTGSSTITVVCAQDRLATNAALTTFVTGILAAGCLLLVGSGCLVRKVVTSAGKPLRQLASQLEVLSPEQLSEQDLMPPGPVELQPIQTAFKRFSGRIKASIERERRVTRNIAHELRTPVAELRTLTELARRWPEDSDLRRESVDGAHEIALHMDRMLRTCLRMARIENGQDLVQARIIDLRATIDRILQQSAAVLEERNLRLETHLADSCQVISDPELLELVLTNLIDNALHHAPPGSSISLSIASKPNQVDFTLTNPSGPWTSTDIDHAPEPFWRREASSESTRHAGLGLAMIQSATHAMGHPVALQVRDGRFEARLSLTAAPVEDVEWA